MCASVASVRSCYRAVGCQKLVRPPELVGCQSYRVTPAPKHLVTLTFTLRHMILLLCLNKAASRMRVGRFSVSLHTASTPLSLDFRLILAYGVYYLYLRMLAKWILWKTVLVDGGVPWAARGADFSWHLPTSVREGLFVWGGWTWAEHH